MQDGGTFPYTGTGESRTPSFGMREGVPSNRGGRVICRGKSVYLFTPGTQVYPAGCVSLFSLSPNI